MPTYGRNKKDSQSPKEMNKKTKKGGRKTPPQY